MEILNNLTKTTNKKQKRVGRGIGSGVGGHTTGRGAKGDKVRGKTGLAFDGTKVKKGWIKRLPFLRGKHRLLSQKSLIAFNLDQLEKWFKSGELVDKVSLAKKSKTKLFQYKQIKILGTGKISKDLKFKGLIFSQNAKKQIISAGGKIEE